LREGKFEGIGGLEIFFRSWRPSGRARAVLVIVHGFNSHSGQYLWAAKQFADAGFAVYALDQRGRGKSGGERFHIAEVAEYVGDVATFVDLAKSREPGLPIFMLGHSAGGVISCVFALDHPAAIAGLICESFAFKVSAPDFLLAIVKGLSRFAPHLPVLKLPNKEFSRDPKVVDSMDRDPLIAREVQPAITVVAMLRANERIRQEFSLMKLPLLILHGAADKVTMPAGSQFFRDTAGSSDKTLKIYPGAAHDLLNDTDRVQVLSDITEWIDARLN
jgi:acylglycerol lipase